MKNLVIVESPTKAKTISKFLSKDYKVESSFGHIRDLPKKEMGIDIEHDFKPTYAIPEKAKGQVKKLKALAAKSDVIWFATDQDREGEAIAWHLKHILKPKKSKRITFHEITKKAIEKSLETPGEIDMDEVDAQQARRILDRLVGYEMSPFLWKKVARGLSAGRVQSVTVRLIVEREKEIEAFQPEEYWTLEAIFSNDKKETIEAKLHTVDGKSLKKFDINNEKDAKEFEKEINSKKYRVANIETKEVKKKTPTPFQTSTLQQDANNKLGFTAKQTMMFAQQLYEGIDLKDGNGSVGLITYMRTDSLNLSKDFVSATLDYIKDTFGKEYASDKPKVFKTKTKAAQEAHEAIRCTHVEYSPESIKSSLNEKQYKLYNLIWSRTVATQMTEAIFNSTSIDIDSDDDKYSFRATGQTMKFDGFMKVYKTESKENLLPELKQEESLNLDKLDPIQHFTQPPPRYTEASLVKVLEEYGIGRPSTYAPTLSTIEDRNYVTKEERRFKPTDIGVTVTDILVEHFPDIVDYQFTAKMEADLDEIAHEGKAWQPIIKEFYVPFHKNLVKKDKELTKAELTEEKTDEKCEKCGEPMIIKMGRFGKFMACTGYPECKTTKPVEDENGETPESEKLDENCPDCKKPLEYKHGRYGKFIGCSGYPDCKFIKKIQNKTGVKCPDCKDGEIVSRKSKRGIFYGCSAYPDCKFTIWGKPTGENCPDCKSLLVYGPKETVKWSNKECGKKESSK